MRNFSNLLILTQLDINFNVETRNKNDFKFQPNVQEQLGPFLTKKKFLQGWEKKKLPVKWKHSERFLAVWQGSVGTLTQRTFLDFEKDSVPRIIKYFGKNCRQLRFLEERKLYFSENHF